MDESGRLESGYSGLNRNRGFESPSLHHVRELQGTFMIKRLLIFAVIYAGSAYAMVFDNRFLPLYLKPFTRRVDAPYHVRIQSFFMHADRAFSDTERLNIPDIDGIYDSVCLARALVATGFENPLRSDFRTRSSIPWTRKGRIDAQGVAFLWEVPLGCYVSVGLNALFAHVSSRQEFFLRGADLQLPPGDKEYLFEVKERMHKLLGIKPGLFSRTGFGDVDLYLRFGDRWDYCFKCRRIDAALKAGVLAPAAKERPLNNPAAIALGGERHWGAYIGLEVESELKEDLIVGLNARASKRFKKTRTARMPFDCEPFHYGALVGPLTVDPGWTFVFNPYVSVEGLREGFGLKAQYTLVSHLRDRLTDSRSQQKRQEQPANLAPLCTLSSWGTEHVTVGAFYDFGLVRDRPCLYPKISAYWDIPVNWLVSKRASKTHSVSLMFDLNF